MVDTRFKKGEVSLPDVNQTLHLLIKPKTALLKFSPKPIPLYQLNLFWKP